MPIFLSILFHLTYQMTENIVITITLIKSNVINHLISQLDRQNGNETNICNMILCLFFINEAYAQRTCEQQCLGQAQFLLCIEQCGKQRAQLGLIVGSSIGGVLFLALLIYITVVCIRSKQCQIFRQKNRRNNVDANIMTQDEFYKHRRHFQNLLEDTLQRSTFQSASNESIKTRKQPERVEVLQYKLTPYDQFIFKLQIVAKDQVGEWLGQGFYLVSKQGLQVWWMKYYQSYEQYKHLEHQHVIYQGKLTRQKAYEGTWYYRGFQNDSRYSGKWTLMKRGTKLQSIQHSQYKQGDSLTQIKSKVNN